VNNKEKVKLKREKILNYDKIKLNKKVKICIVPRYKKVKKRKKKEFFDNKYIRSNNILVDIY